MLNLCYVEKYYSPYLTPDISETKTPQHLTAWELKEKIGEDLFAHSFKFAMIRNPWDRFVSEYCWRKENREGAILPSFEPKITETIDAFAQCLEWPKEQREHFKLGFDGHLETQGSFIINPYNNHIIVDFVGRYENLEQDLKFICHTLGVLLKDIPVIRASKREKDYRQYYTNTAKKAVAKFYADDIDFGSYVF